ncbi:hypothetical protein N0V90_009724 [Kalmusia sp. IMI 367209]|nr:hypothetical protein N0V90_009724 [Kalmusia sp. IMI 367209]
MVSTRARAAANNETLTPALDASTHRRPSASRGRTPTTPGATKKSGPKKGGRKTKGSKKEKVSSKKMDLTKENGEEDPARENPVEEDAESECLKKLAEMRDTVATLQRVIDEQIIELNNFREQEQQLQIFINRLKILAWAARNSTVEDREDLHQAVTSIFQRYPTWQEMADNLEILDTLAGEDLTKDEKENLFAEFVLNVYEEEV